jgi:hypothetical protein
MGISGFQKGLGKIGELGLGDYMISSEKPQERGIPSRAAEVKTTSGRG